MYFLKTKWLMFVWKKKLKKILKWISILFFSNKGGCSGDNWTKRSISIRRKRDLCHVFWVGFGNISCRRRQHTLPSVTRTLIIYERETKPNKICNHMLLIDWSHVVVAQLLFFSKKRSFEKFFKNIHSINRFFCHKNYLK